MFAVMIKDEYTDITPGFPYEVDKIFSRPDGHIKLKGCPRRYEIECFDIFHDGKRISYKEAYRLYKLGVVKEKLGMGGSNEKE